MGQVAARPGKCGVRALNPLFLARRPSGQFVAEDLARRAARHLFRGDEFDKSWTLIGRQMLAAPADNLRRCGGLAFP